MPRSRRCLSCGVVVDSLNCPRCGQITEKSFVGNRGRRRDHQAVSSEYHGVSTLDEYLISNDGGVSRKWKKSIPYADV